MRPLAVLVEFSLLVLFSPLSGPDHAKNQPPSVAAKSKRRQQSKWWAAAGTRARSAGLAVMVVGALLQFIKRVCILVIGLLRLSYRKVSQRHHALARVYCAWLV